MPPRSGRGSAAEWSRKGASAFPYQREPVADGEDHALDALVVRDHVVERQDGPRVVVRCLRVGDGATPQRVVDEDHAVAPQTRQYLRVVARVVRLVGVDEREVELLPRRKLSERVAGRCEPKLDLPVEPGALPVLPGDGRPFLVHVAAQERAVAGKTPGDADRRVARERADLDRRPGTDEPC